MLFNEPKLLKYRRRELAKALREVSVLFNEPKLLKWSEKRHSSNAGCCFSALQRAEIAEIRLLLSE